MLCPHCQKEHAESERMCPTTGLPIAHRVICPACGQTARPGARYCAVCGVILSRAQSTIQQVPNPSAGENSEAIPDSSQRVTRPSVSLVELSRRKTQASRNPKFTSPHAVKQWARQSRAWQLIGYALLLIVLLAGVAGLYLIWYQLR